jgi:hypothetical protein
MTQGLAQTRNGFDLSNSSIPVDQILPGGPPRDGIPSIDQPVFYPASSKLEGSTRILGVKYNGIAKAYPIKIMTYHEIVNDDFNGKKAVITYCPLCGSGIAFVSSINGENYTFGVSGLLYNSDVLLYDRETNSLWSQLLFKSVVGSQKSVEFEIIVTENTTWGDWKNRYPSSVFLSEETGHIRDYSRSPYGDYDTNQGIYFPVSIESDQYHRKEKVLGIILDGKHKVYPFSELQKSDGDIHDVFKSLKLTIIYDKESDSARAIDQEGNEIPSITTFWFAWYAFYPDSKIFKARK